ncbi:MAG: hypothetical protein KGJ02_03745 [Verrucomicrobiota bacterium]|nr:hypothetical protein [Verrucomicrobiota bacterium]
MKLTEIYNSSGLDWRSLLVNSLPGVGLIADLSQRCDREYRTYLKDLDAIVSKKASRPLSEKIQILNKAILESTAGITHHLLTTALFVVLFVTGIFTGPAAIAMIATFASFAVLYGLYLGNVIWTWKVLRAEQAGMQAAIAATPPTDRWAYDFVILSLKQAPDAVPMEIRRALVASPKIRRMISERP